jgi:hypothetical protein
MPRGGRKPAANLRGNDEKLLLIAVMASGLVACTQSPAPKEDSKLKDAYSACINTAEGNPDKVEACQSVLTC